MADSRVWDFARGFVGEGHRHDIGRHGALVGNQPGNARGQHLVLPLPAPASTSAEPAPSVTARNCSGFKPAG